MPARHQHQDDIQQQVRVAANRGHATQNYNFHPDAVSQDILAQLLQVPADGRL
jgi:hypothetical protein